MMINGNRNRNENTRLLFETRGNKLPELVNNGLDLRIRRGELLGFPVSMAGSTC